MGGLSWWHWLVIGGAFILLFGAKKLPDAARGVGRSLRILKSEVAAMGHAEAVVEPGAGDRAVPAGGAEPAGPASVVAPAPLAAPVAARTG